MPHAQGRSRSSLLLPLAAAAAVVAVRLPFLLKGEAFFNADEAVEGLMARHLDQLPVFFWGQGYKGVPEVYVDGAIFSLFGMGVIQLKSVTLALAAISTAALVRLAEVWHGTRAAFVTALLLVAGTPALVYWQLSANAEVAVLSGILAAMLLDYERGLRELPGTVKPRMLFWCGLALWIHPVATCAVLALMVTIFLRSPLWQTERWAGLGDIVLAKGRRPVWRAVTLVVHVAIAILAVLFIFTFLGGSLDLGLIRATHPQRSLRPLALLCGLAILGSLLHRAQIGRRRILISGAWLAAGLAPVLFQALRGGGIGTNVITRRVTDMPEIVHGLAFDVMPIVAGLRDGESHSLGLPAWCIGAMAIAIVLHMIRGRDSWRAALLGPISRVQPKYLFTPLALVAVLLLLTVGGGFQGSSSSRHFMPFWGLIVVSAAEGLAAIWSQRRVAAALLLCASVTVFAVGQYRWYERLRPDPSAHMLIDCLERQGLRVGRADYWIAYRLTFLAQERIIIAPDLSEDRYTPYRRIVDAAPRRVRIEQHTSDPAERGSGGSGPTPAVLCQAPSLRAIEN